MKLTRVTTRHDTASQRLNCANYRSRFRGASVNLPHKSNSIYRRNTAIRLFGPFLSSKQRVRTQDEFSWFIFTKIVQSAVQKNQKTKTSSVTFPQLLRLHSSLWPEKFKEGFSSGVVTWWRLFNTSPCLYSTPCFDLLSAIPANCSWVATLPSAPRRSATAVSTTRWRYDSDDEFSLGPRSHFFLFCKTNEQLATPPYSG